MFFPNQQKLLKAQEQQGQVVVTGLGILNVVLDYQLAQFVQSNMQQLHHVLLGCLTSDNPKIIASLCILLSKMIKTFPLHQPQPQPQPHPEITSFYSDIEQTISTTLGSDYKASLWCVSSCATSPRFPRRLSTTHHPATHHQYLSKSNNG